MDVVLKPPPVKVKLNDDGKARASAERLSPEIMSPMSPGGHQLKSNLKEASEVVRAIDDAVNQPPPRSPRSAALLSRLLKGRTRDLGGGPSQGAPAMSPTDDAGREGSAADASPLGGTGSLADEVTVGPRAYLFGNASYSPGAPAGQASQPLRPARQLSLDLPRVPAHSTRPGEGQVSTRSDGGAAGGQGEGSTTGVMLRPARQHSLDLPRVPAYSIRPGEGQVSTRSDGGAAGGQGEGGMAGPMLQRTESCPLALPEFLLDIVMEPDGDGRDWQSLVQEVRQRPQSPRGSMQALHKLASTSCDLTPLDQSIEARKAVFESECSLLRSRLSELKGHIRALQT